jgi:hypothetical protein
MGWAVAKNDRQMRDKSGSFVKFFCYLGLLAQWILLLTVCVEFSQEKCG